MVGNALAVYDGPWDPADARLTHQWLRNDVPSPYTPVTADVGKTVRVLVTASAPGYATARVRIIAPKPVTAPDPTQKTAPAVQGSPVVGSSIAVSGGVWSDRNSEVKKSFQWRRDGTPITGATGRNYTPTGADFGKSLSVKVTSTLDARILRTQTVDAPAKVAVGTLQTGTPTMAGTAKVGTLLTAAPGSWTKGAVFKYRWLRDGVTISDAYAATYKVRTADRNARITLRVTGTLLGYTAASRDSGAFIAR